MNTELKKDFGAYVSSLCLIGCFLDFADLEFIYKINPLSQPHTR